MSSAPSRDDSDVRRSVVADRLDAFARRGRAALTYRFGVDARGLAAFRIALGLLVFADLLFRGRELQTFYTDAGVLPRAALAEFAPTMARFSLHAQVGSTAGIAALFVVAGCLATALTVGYWTRLATVGTAAMHASMYARNPSLMNGGDGLLMLALALAVFLPLGARWSIDALRRDGPPERVDDRGVVASLSTATLLAQLVIVYVANAAFKLQSDDWMSGTAVQTILELQQFSVLLGPHLTAYPTLLTAINWAWVVMLAAAPLLVLTSGWRRTLVVVAFVLAHVGMLSTMRLGLFPLVVVAVLLPYLPPGVWEWTERRLATADARKRLSRALDGRVPSGFDGEFPPTVRRLVRSVGTVILACFLVVSVLWPATAVGVVDAEERDAVPNFDGYTWTLFAPNPPSSTRWFLAPATLSTGEKLNAFDGRRIEWDPPADAADTYPSTLWHRYLGDMQWASDEEQTYLAAHLCRRAGTYTDAEVTEVAVYSLSRPVESAGGGNVTRKQLVRHDCRNGT